MPGQGTKIPQATWRGQKKKKKINVKGTSLSKKRKVTTRNERFMKEKSLTGEGKHTGKTLNQTWLFGGVNGGLWVGSCKGALPRTSVASVLVPMVSHNHPPPLQ